MFAFSVRDGFRETINSANSYRAYFSIYLPALDANGWQMDGTGWHCDEISRVRVNSNSTRDNTIRDYPKRIVEQTKRQGATKMYSP